MGREIKSKCYQFYRDYHKTIGYVILTVVAWFILSTMGNSHNHNLYSHPNRGGHYVGGVGSSHKGGHYRNRFGGDTYLGF